MRPGGSSQKGAEFERVVCHNLSLWVSRGARADLFTRNVASGGVFTAAVRRRDSEHGFPGDIMPAHAEGHLLCDNLLVECKHYKDLGLGRFVSDSTSLGITGSKSYLAQVVLLCAQQAAHAKKQYMIVARENGRPTIAVLSAVAGAAAQEATYTKLRMYYHWLALDSSIGPVQPGAVLMTNFGDFMRVVNPNRFLELVSTWRSEQKPGPAGTGSLSHPTTSLSRK